MELTGVARVKFNAYYMVDTNPLDGCVNEMELTEQCGDVIVKPWGSLSPVYSPNAALIYKNQICATCHGKNDTIPWSEFQACQRNDVVFGVTKNGTLPNYNFVNCFIYFTIQQFKSKIQIERCYENMKSSCLENFTLPLSLPFHRKEIEKACTSGFYSPYVYLENYVNVFCYICNKNNFNPRQICESGIRTHSSMFVLLDGAFTQTIQIKQTKPRREACKFRLGQVVFVQFFL